MSRDGDIILLNGSSSAGKTTLAYALQEQLPDPWLHISLDQFRDGLPSRYRGLNAPPGSTGDRGLNVIPVIDPLSDAAPYTRISFGDIGQAMLRGMRRAVAAMAAEGNHVIIDDILFSREFLIDYLVALSGLRVYLVGVRCSAAEVSRREARRPGRFPGTATGHMESCHEHLRYDISVDTSVHAPAVCASRVVDHISTHEPNAFPELTGLHTNDVHQ